MNNTSIQKLKEALDLSPDNVPLRMHLADELVNAKLFSEAEEEYKKVLDLSPSSVNAKYGLAKSCYEQKKYSLAYVVLEELCNAGKAPAEYHIMFAKVLLNEGMRSQAQEQYKKALEKDRFGNDAELDKFFRINAVNAPEDISTDEEGKNYSGKMMMEKPQINFDDIGGMAKAKEEIQLKIIHPLNYPELYKAYGKKTGGGILLYGPPGCGKTHLARATAGQVKARFLNIGINDVLDMWIGNSEKNLHDLFEMARQNTPCVLFFDEVDALGASRTDMKHSAGRHLINQFLSEMDGVDSSNEGILILAATNAPWHLDPAFRRPGRFDRIIFIQPPDKDSREQILKILLKDKPVSEISHGEIAGKTDQYSGADLKSLLDLVIEEKIKSSFTHGIPQPISTKDILNKVSSVLPSTKEWFTIARNYALYANDAGLYDDILNYLKIKK